MADITLGSSASAVSARPELSIHDGTVTTTSNQIAAHFGKQHKAVLRAIRNLRGVVEADFYQRNFVPIQISTDLGMGRIRKDPAYLITRDGFVFLVMGFIGKEAAAWKVAYLEAFNRMEAELQKPAYDPARIQLAHSLAAQAAAQVTQTVFDAIASGRDSDWRRARYLLSFGYDRDGQATIPQAQVVGDDQMVTSLNALIQHITKHDVLPSDAQLAALVTACAHQLSERAQIRDRRAATKTSTAPATSTAVAAPIPPHIGTDGKPLPPGTFRAVFV